MVPMMTESLCNARHVIEPATDLSPEVCYSCGRPFGHGTPVEGQPFSAINKMHIAYGDHGEVLCVWKEDDAT